MCDEESQKDEICVLESIYIREEFQSISENDKITGRFDAFIELPSSFTIVYKNLNLEEAEPNRVAISHLPPISLFFELPCNYPSSTPPDFQLSCSWLSIFKLKKLAAKLLKLWQENQGTVVLYTWTHFLKEESLEFLGLSDCLDISFKYTQELKKLVRAAKMSLIDGRNSKEGVEMCDAQNMRSGSKEKSPYQAADNRGVREPEMKSSILDSELIDTNEAEREKSKESGDGSNKPAGTPSRKPPEKKHWQGAKEQGGRWLGRPRYSGSSYRNRNRGSRSSSAKGGERSGSSGRGAKGVSPDNSLLAGSTTKMSQLDLRVRKTPFHSLHLHDYLIKYDEEKKRSVFCRNIFRCNICFEERLGVKCIQFKPCDHVYCRECISGYFQVRIKEGSVISMPCPQEKCKSEATQQQIRELVGPTLFSKYDNLLLSATLNSMEDITYCPRTACQCPVMRESDEKMAACPSCQYVFCVYCKMTYHGVEPCRLKSEEKRILIAQYQNGDEETKRMLEARYGKRQIQNIIQIAQSESWITENSKQCPQCSAAIEKSDGCNRMVCWKCNTYFCWLCATVLDPLNSYLHFHDPASKCRDLLFHGTYQEDGPDDDDDDEDFLDEDFNDNDIF